jgi:hypothetical protein
MSRRTRIWVIAGSVSIAVVAVFLLPPIPQSQAYHSFADQRTMLGIPRCLDVVSNAYCVLRMLELRSPQLATGDAAPDVLD